MTTEIMSKNRGEPVIVEAGFFYSISKEGNVVRFKPGRKKKETQSPTVAEAVVAGEIPAAEVLNDQAKRIDEEQKQ